MANFKVHARVLDLLGEEQIADCPTAMSELFKNAYDAYASKVNLDVYLQSDKALLWDDGQGMSEDDVLSRWLVVGTPGKKGPANYSTPPDGLPARPVMGEKGIGRLAISTVGDTLFLLTKKTSETVSSYTALLINWNIVRNDQLLLSEIYVPVISFNSLDDLSSGICEDMVSSFLSPILSSENDNRWVGFENYREKIINQLNKFTLDIPAILRTGISTRESGTIFFMSDLASELGVYITPPDRNEVEKDNPQALLVQLLGSFQKERHWLNALEISSEEHVDFKADVRAWDYSTSTFRSVFDDWQTFNEDDLAIADHHFKITFDEEGRYSGTIRRYDQEIDISLDLSKSGLNLNCGKFSLEFWYWQGERGETRLTAEQKSNIDRKLQLFGGILLYRDDLRVLPYGRPEFDWLKIEERRSLNAGREFFSYRRMFGWVSISRQDNPQLRDKAGREGLKINKEFRDFRRGLINFLTRTARDYFGGSSEFKEQKAEIEARNAILEKELKKVENRRKQLKIDLIKRVELMRSAEQNIQSIMVDSYALLQRYLNDGDAENAIKVNIDFENKISRIEENVRLIIPSNLSLGKNSKLKELKHDFEQQLPIFRAMCENSRREFSSSVKKILPDIEVAAFRKRTIDSALLQGRSRIGKAYAEIRSAYGELISSIENMIEDKKNSNLNMLEQTLMSLTLTTDLDAARNSQFGDLTDITNGIDRIAIDAQAEILDYGSQVLDYLDNLLQNDGGVILAAQSDEIEDLRRKVNQNLELVQLGLSVEIIDHDLQKIYRGIKSNISKLQMIWKNSPKSTDLLSDLRTNFQHLEQRYQLMSPLYRNSYRRKTEISGFKIYEFIKNFLHHELEIHNVQLQASEGFLEFSITDVPARILPVFINVVDNAIFWCKDVKQAVVILDLADNVVTINDNGPGIHPTIIERIFDPFESEKPSGRGLGLHIARANLEIGGHKIWAELNTRYRTLAGACICIAFNKNATN